MVQYFHKGWWNFWNIEVLNSNGKVACYSFVHSKGHALGVPASKLPVKPDFMLLFPWSMDIFANFFSSSRKFNLKSVSVMKTGAQIKHSSFESNK